MAVLHRALWVNPEEPGDGYLGRALAAISR